MRDKLRKAFIANWTKVPKLEEDDIKSQTMGMCGEDIVLSPISFKNYYWNPTFTIRFCLLYRFPDI